MAAAAIPLLLVVLQTYDAHADSCLGADVSTSLSLIQGSSHAVRVPSDLNAVSLDNRESSDGATKSEIHHRNVLALAAHSPLILCVFYIIVVNLVLKRTDKACSELQGHWGPPGHASGRIVYLDNAKFLALVLVIWGHCFFDLDMMDPKVVYKATWFHMPLLCMLSGSVSTAPLTEERFWRFVASTVGPLFLFTCVLMPMFIVVSQLSQNPEEAWLDFAFHKVQMYLAPTWYLPCLIVWRLSAWICDMFLWQVQFSKQLQFAFAVMVGTAVASYSPVVSSGGWGFILLERIGTLGPFFFVGRCLDWNLMVRLIQPGTFTLCASWASLLALFVSYQLYEHSADRLLLSLETYPYPFVSYKTFGTLPWARYWANLFFRGLMATCFFLFCVPRDRTFFTTRGSRTIYPYLLHIPVLEYCTSLGLYWRTSFAEAGSWHTAKGEYVGACMLLFWFGISFALTYFLASSTCQRIFSGVLQPNWLFNVHNQDSEGTRGTESSNSQ